MCVRVFEKSFHLHLIAAYHKREINTIFFLMEPYTSFFFLNKNICLFTWQVELQEAGGGS